MPEQAANSGNTVELVLTPCKLCGTEVAWPPADERDANPDPCICTECIYGDHKRLRRALEAIHHYTLLDVGAFHTADLVPCGQDLCLLCLVEGTAKDALNGKAI